MTGWKAKWWLGMWESWVDFSALSHYMTSLYNERACKLCRPEREGDKRNFMVKKSKNKGVSTIKFVYTVPKYSPVPNWFGCGLFSTISRLHSCYGLYCRELAINSTSDFLTPLSYKWKCLPRLSVEPPSEWLPFTSSDSSVVILALSSLTVHSRLVKGIRYSLTTYFMIRLVCLPGHSRIAENQVLAKSGTSCGMKTGSSSFGSLRFTAGWLGVSRAW